VRRAGNAASGMIMLVMVSPSRRTALLPLVKLGCQRPAAQKVIR